MSENPPAALIANIHRAVFRPLSAVAILSSAINILLLTLPLYMMQIFDRVLASQSIDTLLYLTIIALFALLAMALFDLIRAHVLLSVAEWLDARLSPELFKLAIERSIDGSGNRSEPIRDLGTVRSFLGGGSVAVLLDAPWAPVFIAATWLLHPLLGAIALGAALVLFGLALASHLSARGPLASANRHLVQAGNQIAVTIRGAEAIRAMGMGKVMLARWFAESMQALRHNRAATARAATLSAVSKFTRLAVQVLLMGAGAWLVTRHTITGGAMIAGSIMMSRALAPVEQAIGLARQFSTARLAYKRVKDVLLSGPPLRSAMALPQPLGHVRVENLVWMPAGWRRPVLRNIAFELAPGESLAVLGPSAAGKSSLARLLVGVCRPSGGYVRLDGAEICDWPNEDVGRHVGYLPQEVLLFPGTIAENIARMGEPNAELVVEAARKVGIHEMVLRLSNGYDTPIDERGIALSGGQRQRIGLARAVYGNPCLLVLDEPNANLDSEGEAALSAAISQLKADGATVVLITHRPALLAHIDKVMVLREGVTDLYGPRKEILDRLRPRPESAQSAHRAVAVAERTA